MLNKYEESSVLVDAEGTLRLWHQQHRDWTQPADLALQVLYVLPSECV